MIEYNLDYCPTCEGDVIQKMTTYSIDFGFGVVVVRDVPAFICQKCGTKWFDHDTTVRLDRIIKDAKKRHNVVEVSVFSDVA